MLQCAVIVQRMYREHLKRQKIKEDPSYQPDKNEEEKEPLLLKNNYNIFQSGANITRMKRRFGLKNKILLNEISEANEVENSLQLKEVIADQYNEDDKNDEEDSIVT